MKCDKCGYETEIDFAHACTKAMAHITQGELMALSQERFELHTKVAALKADAKRWQKMRKFLQDGSGTLDMRGSKTDEEFDARIDAAMKESK